MNRALDYSAVTQPWSQAQPAAGADFLYTLPSPGSYKFETIFFTFATSAAVANRVVKLQITDAAGNVLWEGGGQATIAASSGYRFSAQRLGGQSAASGPGLPNLGALPDVWLPAGYILKSLTNLIDVADQFSVIRGLQLVSSADYV